MAHDVFISYAKEDESTARAVDERLAASGINSWASFKMEPGQRWHGEIFRAIEQSQVFILILSRASNVSKYVKAEAQTAFDSEKEILIIPFVIERVTPTDDLRLLLIGLHWLPATPPREEHYAKLTGRVSRWLERRGTGGAKKGRAPAASKKSAKRAAAKTSKKRAAPSAAPRASAKKGPARLPADAGPEALLDHIATVLKKWPGTSLKKRRTEGSALTFFLSFLGLRHGATAREVRALHGPAEAEPSSGKKYLALHYRAKGLSVYFDRGTRKVSLIAVKALGSEAWQRWRRTQPDLKYLGTHRSHIVRKFGQPNSKIEMSRLDSDVLDYDFTGFRNRSGYVAFHCPARAGRKCTSVQIYWFH